MVRTWKRADQIQIGDVLDFYRPFTVSKVIPQGSGKRSLVVDIDDRPFATININDDTMFPILDSSDTPDNE